MTDPRERLQSGLADRYHIERELGRGGMATVFLATDLKHKRPVALKLLHPELAQTLGPERFQREIDTAARLQHPHILTVHDSGETDGQLWFTMPFVEGESLRERLRREVQLPVDEALRIATDAARALEYAHHHGVVHRDIKPENLLLTTDGSTLVADFGIARALSEGEDRLTQTGMSVGTPAYMSPEQAAGDRSLDARSDIYSLGCVFYEMLAGEPPFSGPTAQAVLAKRLSGEVPHVREVRPSVPEAVEHAVTRALAPVVADRFPTAAEFARALQTTLATPTVPLAPGMGSGSSRVAPLGGRSRRRVPVAPLTLALGFLLGLGVLFAWRRSRVGGGEAGSSKVLAVLPFENLGDSADAYFSDGVSDEIRTKLAQVAGIQVIARGSSTEYRKTVTRGDSTAARRALGLAHQVADSTTVVAYVALREELLWLLDDAQQRLILTLTPADLDGGRADWAIAVAQTYWRRGDRPKARAYGDTANVAFEALLGDIPNDGDRAQIRVLHALALAHLGREQEAVRRGSEALHAAREASAPASQRAYIQSVLIRIHLLAKEHEEALDQLEQLLNIPESYVSPGWLRMDPTYAPLRGKPRFERSASGT